MRIRIQDATYDDLRRLVERISKEYDDVYVEVRPEKDGGFYVHIVIRAPEVEIAKILWGMEMKKKKIKKNTEKKIENEGIEKEEIEQINKDVEKEGIQQEKIEILPLIFRLSLFTVGVICAALIDKITKTETITGIERVFLTFILLFDAFLFMIVPFLRW